MAKNKAAPISAAHAAALSAGMSPPPAPAPAPDEKRDEQGDLVKYRLALEIFEEVDGLEELVTEITEEVEVDGKKVIRLKADTSIDEPSPLDSAITALGLLRLKAKDIATEAARRIEAAIPTNVAEELSVINKDKADLTKRLGAIGTDVEVALSALVEAGTLPKSNKAESGVTLTVVYKDKVELIDANKVPDEYLLPRAQCIDMKKLGEALTKHAEKVEAAKTLELPEPPNPLAEAAKIGKSFSFTTKVPEVVE